MEKSLVKRDPNTDFTGYLGVHCDGLAQACGNSNADALELPQSCTKPSIYA